LAIGRKTGGKIKGVSKHKPKPIILAPTDENRALALMAPTAEVRTPKAVMLSAMLKFERMSDVLMSKAERLTKAHAKPEGIAKLVAEAHRFTVAAVQCAEKVAPYIHARLLAVESRGDMTEDKAPYVVRVPTVMTSSADWQTAVGAALIEAAASQPDNGPLQASLPHPAKSQPADPEGPPVPASVVLRADQKGRISTVMPAVPKVVQPAGTQEWLDSVAASRKAG
jgi:hypothetical protein